MQSRAVRAFTRAVVAASTAGAIATAFWLLNRILDAKELQCIEEYDNANDESCEDDDSYQQLDTDTSFASLPVVSESDDESEDDTVGYTDDYFTAPYDICMLSVSVQTQVDPLQDVPPVGKSDCRLCRAAGTMDSTGTCQDLLVDGKVRALSFSETDSSSDGSVLSFASEFGDGYDEEALQQRPRACSRTEQWLYVRL